MSQIAQLVAELKVDRDQLEEAIRCLNLLYESAREPKQKRKLSAAAKARIAAAQRKRWAKYRKEKKSA